MGEDDEHICTECGTQLQKHSLAVREDGVVIAQGLFDGMWFTCGDLRFEADAEVDKYTIDRLKREYGEDD
jgi:hypothetical protein